MKVRLATLPRWFLLMLAGIFVASAPRSALAAEDQSDLAEMLSAGDLAGAEQSLAAALEDYPDDQQTRLQLGVVQFTRGVERLAQWNYRKGTGSKRHWAPFFRLPIPPNPDPEPVGYGDVRGALEQFLGDLTTAEATLAGIGDKPVKWTLDIAAVRLDLNADGKAAPEESLGAVYETVARRGRRRPDDQPAEPTFVVGIDTADAYWLRGYCHVLSAMIESLLAYDQQRMFGLVAQLVFPNAEVEHDFRPADLDDASPHWFNDVLDAVAVIHLIDWPLKEAGRLGKAHEHLLQTISLSRDSWRVALLEDDNDHEWIPNPKQTSVLPRATMSQERIDTWMLFLDEAEALLRGEKLVPLWRKLKRDDIGVNLKHVFLEPQRFDLVLWVQGTAATPYLEEGELTQRNTWTAITRAFDGNFLGFAFWIN